MCDFSVCIVQFAFAFVGHVLNVNQLSLVLSSVMIVTLSVLIASITMVWLYIVNE